MGHLVGLAEDHDAPNGPHLESCLQAGAEVCSDGVATVACLVETDSQTEGHCEAGHHEGRQRSGIRTNLGTGEQT